MNPIESFDMVKAAYTKKKRDAENRGDETTAAQVDFVSLFYILMKKIEGGFNSLIIFVINHMYAFDKHGFSWRRHMTKL